MNVEVYGRFYTADQTIAQYEKLWIDQIKKDVQKVSIFDNNIIINLTWFGPEEDYLKQILLNCDTKTTKVWLVASIDGIYWMYHSNFCEFIKEKFTFEFVGFGPNCWHSWMPKFLLENIKSNEIHLDKNFQFNFLCYNRKPKPHRHDIVNQIINKGLLEYGWVTYEQGIFPSIDQKTGNTDQNLHNNDKRFSRPEDFSSLGNTLIWNNSFCVVVTETEINDPWQISEKTWKPIIGMRPFFLHGHKNLQKILTNLEFYGPSDFFKQDFNDADDITKCLSNLCSKSKHELLSMYEGFYDKLLHNKNVFVKYATRQNILQTSAHNLN